MVSISWPQASRATPSASGVLAMDPEMSFEESDALDERIYQRLQAVGYCSAQRITKHGLLVAIGLYHVLIILGEGRARDIVDMAWETGMQDLLLQRSGEELSVTAKRGLVALRNAGLIRSVGRTLSTRYEVIPV